MTFKRDSLLIALGAGINLSLYGIGVWNGSTALTSGTLLGAAAQSLSDWYMWLAACGMLAGILVRAIVSALTNTNNRYYLHTALWAVGVAVVLLLSGLWTSNLTTLCITAFCTGWSFACLSVFWITRISLSLDQVKYIFSLMLVCAALVNALYATVPQDLLHIFLGGSLLASTLCSFYILATKHESNALVLPKLSVALQENYLPAFKRFAEVLLCVIALQTIAPTMNYLGLTNILDPSTQLAIVCAAQASAALVVVFAIRLCKQPPYSVQFFKYITPVLILALFPVPFAGHTYSLIMLFVGSCLHFVVVNALFCADAIAIARKNNLAFEFFYATGLFVLMIVCVALENIMPLILQSSSSTELLLVFGVFFCVYILSMAFIFARRRRRESFDKETTPSLESLEEPEQSEHPLTEADKHLANNEQKVLQIMQSRYQLSAREVEILHMILHGKNVPAIAEEFVISQNTVRSHIKRIYRATDIHSRQELISYCERIASGEEIT